MKVLEGLKGFFRVDCLARSVQTSEKCTSHQPCNKRTVCTGLKKKKKKSQSKNCLSSSMKPVCLRAFEPTLFPHPGEEGLHPASPSTWLRRPALHPSGLPCLHHNHVLCPQSPFYITSFSTTGNTHSKQEFESSTPPKTLGCKRRSINV